MVIIASRLVDNCIDQYHTDTDAEIIDIYIDAHTNDEIINGKGNGLLVTVCIALKCGTIHTIHLQSDELHSSVVSSFVRQCDGNIIDLSCDHFENEDQSSHSQPLTHPLIQKQLNFSLSIHPTSDRNPSRPDILCAAWINKHLLLWGLAGGDVLITTLVVNIQQVQLAVPGSKGSAYRSCFIHGFMGETTLLNDKSLLESILHGVVGRKDTFRQDILRISRPERPLKLKTVDHQTDSSPFPYLIFINRSGLIRIWDSPPRRCLYQATLHDLIAAFNLSQRRRSGGNYHPLLDLEQHANRLIRDCHLYVQTVPRSGDHQQQAVLSLSVAYYEKETALGINPRSASRDKTKQPWTVLLILIDFEAESSVIRSEGVRIVQQCDFDQSCLPTPDPSPDHLMLSNQEQPVQQIDLMDIATSMDSDRLSVWTCWSYFRSADLEDASGRFGSKIMRKRYSWVESPSSNRRWLSLTTEEDGFSTKTHDSVTCREQQRLEDRLLIAALLHRTPAANGADLSGGPLSSHPLQLSRVLLQRVFLPNRFSHRTLVHSLHRLLQLDGQSPQQDESPASIHCLAQWVLDYCLHHAEAALWQALTATTAHPTPSNLSNPYLSNLSNPYLSNLSNPYLSHEAGMQSDWKRKRLPSPRFDDTSGEGHSVTDPDEAFSVLIATSFDRFLHCCHEISLLQDVLKEGSLHCLLPVHPDTVPSLQPPNPTSSLTSHHSAGMVAGCDGSIQQVLDLVDPLPTNPHWMDSVAAATGQQLLNCLAGLVSRRGSISDETIGEMLRRTKTLVDNSTGSTAPMGPWTGKEEESLPGTMFSVLDVLLTLHRQAAWTGSGTDLSPSTSSEGSCGYRYLRNYCQLMAHWSMKQSQDVVQEMVGLVGTLVHIPDERMINSRIDDGSMGDRSQFLGMMQLLLHLMDLPISHPGHPAKSGVETFDEATVHVMDESEYVTAHPHSVRSEFSKDNASRALAVYDLLMHATRQRLHRAKMVALLLAILLLQRESIPWMDHTVCRWIEEYYQPQVYVLILHLSTILHHGEVRLIDHPHPGGLSNKVDVSHICPTVFFFGHDDPSGASGMKRSLVEECSSVLEAFITYYHYYYCHLWSADGLLSTALALDHHHFYAKFLFSFGQHDRLHEWMALSRLQIDLDTKWQTANPHMQPVSFAEFLDNLSLLRTIRLGSLATFHRDLSKPNQPTIDLSKPNQPIIDRSKPNHCAFDLETAVMALFNDENLPDQRPSDRIGLEVELRLLAHDPCERRPLSSEVWNEAMDVSPEDIRRAIDGLLGPHLTCCDVGPFLKETDGSSRPLTIRGGLAGLCEGLKCLADKPLFVSLLLQVRLALLVLCEGEGGSLDRPAVLRETLFIIVTKHFRTLEELFKIYYVMDVLEILERIAAGYQDPCLISRLIIRGTQHCLRWTDQLQRLDGSCQREGDLTSLFMGTVHLEIASGWCRTFKNCIVHGSMAREALDCVLQLRSQPHYPIGPNPSGGLDGQGGVVQALTTKIASRYFGLNILPWQQCLSVLVRHACNASHLAWLCSIPPDEEGTHPLPSLRDRITKDLERLVFQEDVTEASSLSYFDCFASFVLSHRNYSEATRVAFIYSRYVIQRFHEQYRHSSSQGVDSDDRNREALKMNQASEVMDIVVKSMSVAFNCSILNASQRQDGPSTGDEVKSWIESHTVLSSQEVPMHVEQPEAESSLRFFLCSPEHLCFLLAQFHAMKRLWQFMQTRRDRQIVEAEWWDTLTGCCLMTPQRETVSTDSLQTLLKKLCGWGCFVTAWNLARLESFRFMDSSSTTVANRRETPAAVLRSDEGDEQMKGSGGIHTVVIMMCRSLVTESLTTESTNPRPGRITGGLEAETLLCPFSPMDDVSTTLGNGNGVLLHLLTDILHSRPPHHLTGEWSRLRATASKAIYYYLSRHRAMTSTSPTLSSLGWHELALNVKRAASSSTSSDLSDQLKVCLESGQLSNACHLVIKALSTASSINGEKAPPYPLVDELIMLCKKAIDSVGSTAYPMEDPAGPRHIEELRRWRDKMIASMEDHFRRNMLLAS